MGGCAGSIARCSFVQVVNPQKKGQLLFDSKQKTAVRHKATLSKVCVNAVLFAFRFLKRQT